LNALVLIPATANYAAQQDAATISTQVKGGLPRVRLDVVGGASTVNVAWQCDYNDFNYLQAFYRSQDKGMFYGSNVFTCQLIVDNSDLVAYTCKLVPGTWKAPATQQGMTYTVTAQFYVTPLAVNAVADDSLIDTFTTYGSSDLASSVYNELSQFSNYDLPANL
jgi:hypothetical protein